MFMMTVTVVVPTMGSGCPVALVMLNWLASACLIEIFNLFIKFKPTILHADPESGRAATVWLTPWRERWSLGVAPWTAPSTFTVATNTWLVGGGSAGVGG